MAWIFALKSFLFSATSPIEAFITLRLGYRIHLPNLPEAGAFLHLATLLSRLELHFLWKTFVGLQSCDIQKARPMRPDPTVLGASLLTTAHSGQERTHSDVPPF